MKLGTSWRLALAALIVAGCAGAGSDSPEASGKGAAVSTPVLDQAAVTSEPAEEGKSTAEPAAESIADSAAGSQEETEEAPPAPPTTDIWLVELDTNSQPWSVRDSRRITDRPHYDNQPYFEPGGASLLFTSQQGEQTDVFRYSLADGEVSRVTDTTESEYSPTPAGDGDGFSTVRVEADGTQRLWRFPGDGEAELLFEAIQPVGYHAWLDPQTLALFVLGAPHELVLAEVGSGTSQTVATDIGRALHRVPGRRAVSFVDKRDAAAWAIAAYDLASREVELLTRTPGEVEDFAWWGDRQFLMGSGSKLLLAARGEEAWTEVVDLASIGIAGISRLSVARSEARTHLAVVGERPSE